MKLCLADAIHNKDFEILFIVMFYLQHVQKLVFNGLIKQRIKTRI